MGAAALSRRAARLHAGALLLAAGLLAGAGAATASAEPPDASARLARLHDEIEQLTAERARLSGQEHGLLGRLEALGAEARVLDARLEALGLERSAAERSLRALEARRLAAERRLVQARARLRATVLLLHQAGPFGGLRFVLPAGDSGDLAAGSRLAHELADRSRDDVAAVRAARDEASRLATEAAERSAQLEQILAETTGVRTALARAIDDRRALLTQVRDEQAVRATAIGELERASGALAELLRESETGAAGDAAMGVRLDVKSFRRLLPRPAEGPVTATFGDRRDPRFGTVLPHRGWDIAAPFGAPVHAIFDGRVVWASWFRGYGVMAVVDHGGGVHSVYAHLSAVTVANGDDVEKEQQIGLVGDTGPLGGASLYFEIREAGRAVDPASWIAPAR